MTALRAQLCMLTGLILVLAGSAVADPATTMRCVDERADDHAHVAAGDVESQRACGKAQQIMQSIRNKAGS